MKNGKLIRFAKKVERFDKNAAMLRLRRSANIELIRVIGKGEGRTALSSGTMPSEFFREPDRILGEKDLTGVAEAWRMTPQPKREGRSLLKYMRKFDRKWNIGNVLGTDYMLGSTPAVLTMAAALGVTSNPLVGLTVAPLGILYGRAARHFGGAWHWAELGHEENKNLRGRIWRGLKRIAKKGRSFTDRDFEAVSRKLRLQNAAIEDELGVAQKRLDEANGKLGQLLKEAYAGGAFGSGSRPLERARDFRQRVKYSNLRTLATRMLISGKTAETPVYILEHRLSLRPDFVLYHDGEQLDKWGASAYRDAGATTAGIINDRGDFLSPQKFDSLVSRLKEKMEGAVRIGPHTEPEVPSMRELWLDNDLDSVFEKFGMRNRDIQRKVVMILDALGEKEKKRGLFTAAGGSADETDKLRFHSKSAEYADIHEYGHHLLHEESRALGITVPFWKHELFAKALHAFSIAKTPLPQTKLKKRLGFYLRELDATAGRCTKRLEAAKKGKDAGYLAANEESYSAHIDATRVVTHFLKSYNVPIARWITQKNAPAYRGYDLLSSGPAKIREIVFNDEIDTPEKAMDFLGDKFTPKTSVEERFKTHYERPRADAFWEFINNMATGTEEKTDAA